VAALAEDLGDEERIAAGEPVERLGRVRRALRELADTARRERRQVDPPRAPLAGELAEGLTQGVGRSKGVVAERHQHEHGQPRDAAREEPEEVER
jgi:hypothetical protein